MADTIRRDWVIGVLSSQLLNDVTALDLLEKQAEKNPERLEELSRQSFGFEESIYTLFQVADELELYDEVVSGTVVPQYMKERYWGKDHPKARRRR